MSPSAPTESKPDISHRERPTRTDSSSNGSESPLPGNQQLASALDQQITDEEVQKYQPRLRGAQLNGLRGAQLNGFLAFIAGTGFTLFGYDQGVLSALLTTESFMRTFPQTSPTTGPPNHATLQSLLVAIYEIGCLIGALSNVGIDWLCSFVFFALTNCEVMDRRETGKKAYNRIRWYYNDHRGNLTGNKLRLCTDASSPGNNWLGKWAERELDYFRYYGFVMDRLWITLLFERLGIDDLKSRILAACNGTEYFLASLIAIWLIEKVGRRKLMIFGAIGQTITMVLLAVLGSIDRASTNIVSAVLLFVFNSFFAVGWLGMTWLYPAEITPLRIRQPANALSTASNWAFNFMVVMVTGPSFQSIGYHTYTVFACLNAFIIPVVYLYFPETAGRSLEDMDVVFAQAYNEGISPVSVSLRKDLPPAGSPEADEILGFGVRHRKNNTDSSPSRTEGTRADVEKQG
ncbi:hypothetical protein RSAG8_01196, partial [Rhizoctonia solani AG-8 WAC10335]